MKKELSPSKDIGARTLYAALQVLQENGGELLGRDVLKAVGQRVELSDWARERYEKSGYIRWETLLHFYSIDALKAGYMLKKKQVWYLTPEGEKALELGAAELLNSAKRAYKRWKEDNQKKDDTANDIDDDGETDKEISMTLERIKQVALEDLEKHINSKNPYEFQDLAAALLRGMGYYTPFVAPRGKDGGVDIIAYRDPLGTVSPRIKVQVKHKQKTKVTVDEIRQLMGLLQKGGDVGMFISSGGFTPDTKNTARTSHVHIELIDLSRFFELWQEFYHKLNDEDKAHLPLTPVYFLEPSE